jgi:hypothetical protein
MMGTRRSQLLWACSLMALAVLACSFGTTTSPTIQAMPQVVQSTPEAADTVSPPSNGGNLTLTMPDAKVISMPVTQCVGIAANEYLDVRAATTPDQNDPNRIEVLVGGGHTGAGAMDNMYVSVSIGAKDAWNFQGNTLIAHVVLAEDGSGHFENVGIVNGAAHPVDYQYGQEYKFSANWTCKSSK